MKQTKEGANGRTFEPIAGEAVVETPTEIQTEPVRRETVHGERHPHGETASREHAGERRRGSAKTAVRRGDIFYADLSPVVGSEQGGVRPVLIVQNDVGNRYSPTVIAAAITSKLGKTKLPTHIDVFAKRVGLQKDSVILLEQIRTIDKQRLGEKMGHLDEELMTAVDDAITISFGLAPGARTSGSVTNGSVTGAFTGGTGPSAVPEGGMDPGILPAAAASVGGVPSVSDERAGQAEREKTPTVPPAIG